MYEGRLVGHKVVQVDVTANVVDVHTGTDTIAHSLNGQRAIGIGESTERETCTAVVWIGETINAKGRMETVEKVTYTGGLLKVGDGGPGVMQGTTFNWATVNGTVGGNDGSLLQILRRETFRRQVLC